MKKIIQLMSASNQLYALDEEGQVWMLLPAHGLPNMHHAFYGWALMEQKTLEEATETFDATQLKLTKGGR